MKRRFAMITVFLLSGCLCGRTASSESTFDEEGLLVEPPVQYIVRIRRNAATIRINNRIELVACETFSDNCDWADLDPLPTRLRHYREEIQIQAFLEAGSNTIEISRRPDGEDEPLYFAITKVDRGKKTTLIEGEIPEGSEEISIVQIEIRGGCPTPPLPDESWLLDFLDPLPEASLNLDEKLTEQMLIPPATEAQARLRAQAWEVARSLDSYLPDPDAPFTLHQDHRDVPLTMNYSCENDRLFVFPEDGGDLFMYTSIERFPDGAATSWSASRYAELVYHDNRWYLGTPQSP